MSTTRRVLVTEELREFTEFDRCTLCDHYRQDHIDDLVNGKPVGCCYCSAFGPWHGNAYEHKFKAGESDTRWIEVARKVVA